MSLCCSTNEVSDIAGLDLNRIRSQDSRRKIEAILEAIIREDVPFTCDADSLMVTSPVGNQIKYSDVVKADIVLSGFSTAATAAYNYFNEEENELRECNNAFNTADMRRGVKTLLKSVGFNDPKKVFSGAINPSVYETPNFLFTQILCMVSYRGTSNAAKAYRVIKSNPRFQTQANSCINSWYKRIVACSATGAIIMLMGNEARELLYNTWVEEDTLLIDFDGRRNNEHGIRLTQRLRDEGFEVFYTYHAASLRYPDNLYAWCTSYDRFEICNRLRELHPTAISEFTGYSEVAAYYESLRT